MLTALKRAAAGLAVLALLAGSDALAQTRTLTPSQDTFLRSETPSTPYGSSTELRVKGGTEVPIRAVVAFSLPTLPADEVLASASLQLTNTFVGATLPYNLFRMTEAWSEASATWNTTASKFDPAVLASATSNASGVSTFDVTSTVKAWYAGTTLNQGLMVRGGTNDTSAFHSKESATTGGTPRLVLTTTLIPVFTLANQALLLSDPSNGTANPKRIPGAIIRSVATATNSGRGTATGFELKMAVPAGTRAYVGDVGAAGSGPVVFTQGTPSSGLTFSYGGLASTADSVSFSNDNGVSFNYTPVPAPDGFDSAVTHVRVAPAGTFAAVSGGNPGFTAETRVRLN